MQTRPNAAFPTLALSILVLALAFAGIPAHAGTAAAPAGAEEAARAIDAAALRGPVRFLSHDLLEGRLPGTRGDELARAYLASELETLGLEPGGPDGAWQQPMEMIGITSQLPATWRFTAGDKSVELASGEEYVATSGVQEPRSTIENAEVVFVGYGIEAPEHRWDDFKGADLKGKVLLMLNNDPDWDPALFAGERRLYYGRWTYKYESAARQGALGAIIVHTTPSAGYGWNVVQSSWSGTQFQLPPGDEPRLQVAGWTTEEGARELVALGGKTLDALVESARSRDFRPVPLGVQTSLVLDNEITNTQTANVAGLLPGRDAELADEVVIYTAHHDHLGVGDADSEGDTIYNGARDNAAGVAAVLGVARAMTALPEAQRPRRSVLFLFVAAEEQGLLGSRYYAEHPTFPPGKIAANVNLDAPGIWGRTRDITYIGMGKSSLDAVAAAAAAAQGRTVKGDQFPDRGSFYRSDQFNFARIGVPALYLDNGTELLAKPGEEGTKLIEAWEANNYHQASDELTDEWDFGGMVEDATMAFYAGLAIANAEQMPTWNAGDEFEAARKAALAAVAGTAGK